MMTHQKARLTTRNLCQCLGAFALLLSASSTAAGADASFQELEQQGTLDKQEPARADDGKNYPRLVLHGDYRFLCIIEKSQKEPHVVPKTHFSIVPKTHFSTPPEMYLSVKQE